MTLTSTERARRSAEAMWADDKASAWMGMTIDAVTEGKAILRLIVRADHCNGHGICHGGIIFSLADSAFAFACNSRNQRCVAQHNTITYLSPARNGDRLVATAQEVTRRGRSGIYDVRVTQQDGEVIAEFRGHAREIPGQLFDEDQE